MDAKDVEKLQIDLDRFRDWALENDMKINPGKIKQQTSWQLGCWIHWIIPLMTKKFQKQAALNTLELSYAET